MDIARPIDAGNPDKPCPADPVPSDLVIIGAGEHAKVVISAAETVGRKIVLILDHDERRAPQNLFGYPVAIYTANSLQTLISSCQEAIIAIGDNAARRQIARALFNTSWTTVVHRAAIVDNRARVGHGTLLSAASVVNPDAIVGRHVIINTAAVVEHDVVVGDYCHIAPNATLCGKVRIGEGTLVGAGSVVLPGVAVGAWSFVGAGAAVTRDIPAGATAVGVPARIVSHTRPEGCHVDVRS